MLMIDCPRCRRVLRLPDIEPVQAARCPGCGTTLAMSTENGSVRVWPRAGAEGRPESEGLQPGLLPAAPQECPAPARPGEAPEPAPRLIRMIEKGFYRDGDARRTRLIHGTFKVVAGLMISGGVLTAATQDSWEKALAGLGLFLVTAPVFGLIAAFFAAAILAMVMSPSEKELVSGEDILRRRFKRARRRRKQGSPDQTPEPDSPGHDPDESSGPTPPVSGPPDGSIRAEKPSQSEQP